MIKPIYNGIIIKHIKRKYYDIIHESTNESNLIKYAVSKDGKYIGTTKYAYKLINKYGITQFELAKPTNKVISIGYSPSKHKWYGWSHRAIYGFAVGSKVTKGDIGFIASTLDEFVENMKQFWGSVDDIKIVGKNIIRQVKGSKYKTKILIKDIRFGRGEWQAKTLADAKQMAINFANGVS